MKHIWILLIYRYMVQIITTKINQFIKVMDLLKLNDIFKQLKDMYTHTHTQPYSMLSSCFL